MRILSIASTTVLALVLVAAAWPPAAPSLLARSGAAQRSSTDTLLARAKSLELNTPYVPPPGDPLEHHAAGFANVMCAAVFITGLDPDFAAENVGYFVSPYEIRAKLGKPVIDRAAKSGHVK